jgi:hypothetical protein
MHQLDPVNIVKTFHVPITTDTTTVTTINPECNIVSKDHHVIKALHNASKDHLVTNLHAFLEIQTPSVHSAKSLITTFLNVFPKHATSTTTTTAMDLHHLYNIKPVLSAVLSSLPQHINSSTTLLALII